MDLPTCTVVVATFNRADGLKRLLETLADQDLGAENFEVVVVDDGSTDETWQLLNSVRTPFAPPPPRRRPIKARLRPATLGFAPQAVTSSSRWMMTSSPIKRPSAPAP